MTKSIFLLFLFLSTSISLFPQELNHFPVKSGIIKYELKGRTNGSQIIYFDEFGELINEWNSRIINSAGKTISEASIKIIKNDSIFELDLQSQSINIKPLNKESNQNLQNLISNDMINAMAYKEIGIMNIAGVNCIEYSGENGKLWTWNNIVMKTEMNVMNIHILKEATEIIIGIDIPKTKFEIPENYKTHQENGQLINQ